MRLALSILLQILVVMPLAGQHALQSRSGSIGVVPGEYGPRVRDDRGHSNPLYVPEEVQFHSLVELRGGWLAAGVHAVGEGQDLYLRLLDPGGLKRLPAPADRRARLRHQPVLLSDGETLQGILWLEGDGRRSMAVKASQWLGITWSRPVSVSDVGPGSQVALEATILADGSWLAVWSAFDGEDDEIMWSVGMGGSWTEPAQLSANAVPDILPTVAPSTGGAMVAWNQFDGLEYRVVTLRWQDGRWSEGWQGDRGSLYPQFYLHEKGPTLLYYGAADAGHEWRVRELDGDGQLVRSGRAGGGKARRPLVLKNGDDLTLEWPDSDAVERIVWERSP